MIVRNFGSKSIGNIIPESIIEGKNKSCAIIDTLSTIIDCTSVLFISGITEVKIPPNKKEKNKWNNIAGNQ